MPKCDFSKAALHGCSPVNLLHHSNTCTNKFGKVTRNMPMEKSVFNKVAGHFRR